MSITNLPYVVLDIFDDAFALPAGHEGRETTHFRRVQTQYSCKFYFRSEVLFVDFDQQNVAFNNTLSCIGRRPTGRNILGSKLTGDTRSDIFNIVAAFSKLKASAKAELNEETKRKLVNGVFHFSR